MPQIPPQSRRRFLRRAVGLGCSLAASPIFTPVTIAAAPWEARLVVIVLRGGVDGLDMVQPYGDPDLRGYRAGLSLGPDQGASDLDGYFAMHPALAPVVPLWQAGELGFITATSTPYRDKRSHFDGQDMLEAGGASPGAGLRGGWLNRALQYLPGVETRTAFAIGRGDLQLLTGQAPVADWSPGAELSMSPATRELAERVMADDPLFHAAFSEALMLSEDGEDPTEAGMMHPRKRGRRAHVDIAEFAARQLSGDTRVVGFSLGGWDTHRNQAGGLRRALGRLSEVLLTLKSGLGAQVWGKTAVVAITEFGRTVAENGTGGTDHGTGGVMLYAGGALHDGQVAGDWPGVSEAALYDRRDLMPTSDLRAHLAWALHGITGLGRDVLERAVFDGLDMGTRTRLLR